MLAGGVGIGGAAGVAGGTGADEASSFAFYEERRIASVLTRMSKAHIEDHGFLRHL